MCNPRACLRVVTCQEGNTALHLSCGMGYKRVSSMLLRAGADIKAVNKVSCMCAACDIDIDIDLWHVSPATQRHRWPNTPGWQYNPWTWSSCSRCALLDMGCVDVSWVAIDQDLRSPAEERTSVDVERSHTLSAAATAEVTPPWNVCVHVCGVSSQCVHGSCSRPPLLAVYLSNRQKPY